MEESKRQKQVAQLVQKELSDIFLREGLNIVRGGMVSISKVRITPDLYEAKVYLSLFQVQEPEAFLKEVRTRTNEIRNQLGMRVKNQLRIVPKLLFFLDDTLDYVFKMEELFKKIKDEDEEKKNDTEEQA
jgi:ribosome-binding factor A